MCQSLLSTFKYSYIDHVWGEFNQGGKEIKSSAAAHKWMSLQVLSTLSFGCNLLLYLLLSAGEHCSVSLYSWILQCALIRQVQRSLQLTNFVAASLKMEKMTVVKEDTFGAGFGVTLQLLSELLVWSSAVVQFCANVQTLYFLLEHYPKAMGVFPKSSGLIRVWTCHPSTQRWTKAGFPD